MLRWLIPSFYGDIRFEATGKDSCVLSTEKLTPREEAVLRKLTKKAVKSGWIAADATLVAAKVKIQAPATKIAQAVARLLKPKREIVSAICFAAGKMKEVTEQEYDAGVATAVAVPTKGCPAPDFARAELRARDVLESFLTEDQREDFRKHNRFISRGATTGRRYMITSRHARDSLAMFQRSLFDLDYGFPICVHDWSVPAAEEMLSLHVLLQLPGWESYLTGLR